MRRDNDSGKLGIKCFLSYKVGMIEAVVISDVIGADDARRAYGHFCNVGANGKRF